MHHLIIQRSGLLVWAFLSTAVLCVANAPTPTATLKYPIDPSVSYAVVSTLTSTTNPEGGRKSFDLTWRAYRSSLRFRLPDYYECTLPANNLAGNGQSFYNLYEIGAQGNKHDVDLFLKDGADCFIYVGKSPDYSNDKKIELHLKDGVALERARYHERADEQNPGHSTNYAWIVFSGDRCTIVAKAYHGMKRPTALSVQSKFGMLQLGDGSPPPPLPGGDYSGDENEP